MSNIPDHSSSSCLTSANIKICDKYERIYHGFKVVVAVAELPNGIMLVAKRIKIDKNGMIEYGNGFTLHKFE